ncbi:Pentapeptide repeat-containing protein [Bradyrhizobium sp. NFR13]|jgi:hypothetical protein|uniref:pentapeptide repeat-containing protein n=1 Tax=Bradyrhizobium sp. NFR13 TaxID=1566285 RepID=UPI0008DFCBF6|nr:pentapeptide repeat-containing protein [Bradyrhizobium sp. NFR13]SFL71820.1 Pentapeptide repeat-containing protein [Bradyrhizobium sp. NFR13]
MSEAAGSDARIGPARRSTQLVLTLVVGLVVGAFLGPALFLAIGRLELSGDILLSFAIGAFLTTGICLAVAVIGWHVILPRILMRIRTTLDGTIGNLTSAGRALVDGDAAKVIDHLGRAAAEGVSWYSIGTTRRFIVQAALGLLVSFGSTVGAVLLFSQNTLLRDQNALLKDQNVKIDKQLDLLSNQNRKIDQQTAVADAQKRSAFVTEMFSILQEVAKTVGPDGTIGRELATRIAVLSTSAVPYIYLDFSGTDEGIDPKRIARPLSPERGQLVVALARMGVKFEPLMSAGAVFDSSDLRGVSLLGADLSRISLENSDLSSANLNNSRFFSANLRGATIRDVRALSANFDYAAIVDSVIENSNFGSATFKKALVQNLRIRGGKFERTNFVDCFLGLELSFENVGVEAGLPSGLDWPDEVRKRFESGEQRLNHSFHLPLNVERVGMPVPSTLGR